jgi:hypothetical protein
VLERFVIENDDLLRLEARIGRFNLFDALGISPAAATTAEAVDALEQDARWEVLYRSSKHVDFVPKTWLEWLAPLALEDRYPFCVNLRSKEESLVYTLWIGPMKDTVKRGEFVNKLRQASPDSGFKRTTAYRLEGKWNRITGADTILEWGDENEPEPSVIRATVKKFLDDLYPKLEKLASVFKPLSA